VEKVRRYILWCIDHTQRCDKWGLSGTIYDYKISKNGVEYSLETYDSADGYAGMFLKLVATYYTITKDKETIENIWPILEEIAYMILYLQEDDGLTRALNKPGYHVKFLMDNVESYIGLLSFIKLAKLMDKQICPIYRNAKKNLFNGIMHKLYNLNNHQLYWAIDGNIKMKAGKNRFYPDVFARIHMVALMKKKLSKKIKNKLWNVIQYFMSNYKPYMSSEQKIVYGWALH
jgi:hypothetical protein